MHFSCQCGDVRVSLSQRPDFLNDCNCSLCAKSGARWAYVHPDTVTVEGPTTGWRRNDKADPAAEVHFCPRCGSTTHYVLTESAVAKHGNVLMGVNAWLADPADLAGIELRFPDGRGWDGTSEFGYVRETVILGRDGNTAP